MLLSEEVRLSQAVLGMRTSFRLDDRQKRREDPFLIYYGFSHPHDVRDGTPSF